MKIGFKQALTLTLLLTLTFMLTACGSSQFAFSPTPSNSNTNTNTNTASNTSNTPGTNPSCAASASNSACVPTAPSTVVNPAFQPSAQLSMYFSQIRDRALEGGMINCPYVAGTLIDQVKKDWGAPSQENAAGMGIYATYTANDISFGYNKGGQIFDIRNSSKTVQAITLARLISEFGQPNQVNYTYNQQIYVYNVNDNYQLQFVMPTATAQNPDPQMDHYNLYWPKGAENLMLNHR